MVYLILKLVRGLVVEDFFTVAKNCEFHSNHEVQHDFPKSFPMIPFVSLFPQEIVTCGCNKVNQQLCITSG